MSSTEVRKTIETLEVRRSTDGDGNKCINQYVLIKSLGKGSYSKVKLCINTLDNELYAMKLCHKPTLQRKRRGSGTALDEVFKEVDILKKLRHPNIVTLFEVLDDPSCDTLFLVFEFLELGPAMTLSTSFADQGLAPPAVEPLEEGVARSYFKDALNGLEYLHTTVGVVHGDIKPANLLVSAESILKIIDFGLAEYIDKEGCASEHKESIKEAKDGDEECNNSLTSSFSTPATSTPAFTPPEAISWGLRRDRGTVATSPKPHRTPEGDIWALGVTLYCFLVGRLPFETDNVLEMCCLIREQEVNYPATISDEAKNLIQGMLHKDPAQRYTIQRIKQHRWLVDPC
ncbi:Calcium calmodulin-dependent protein kinase kinase 2 [Balamuthia mandrillaris]